MTDWLHSRRESGTRSCGLKGIKGITGVGNPAAHVPLFTKTSFDGCWNWYEEGKHLYKVTIAEGEVVSFQPRHRSATRTTESAATCAIDSVDGLIVISTTERAGNDRWRTVTTLRFDISDAPPQVVPESARHRGDVGPTIS